MSIEAKIRVVVDAFVSDLTAMVRQAALAEVRDAIAASPLSAPPPSRQRDQRDQPARSVRGPRSTRSTDSTHSTNASAKASSPPPSAPPSKRAPLSGRAGQRSRRGVQLSFLDEGPATVRSENKGASASAPPQDQKATSLSRIASVVGNVSPAAPSSTRRGPRIIPIPATFTAPLEPKREPSPPVGPLPPIQVLPPRGRRRRSGSASPAKPKPIELAPAPVEAVPQASSGATEGATNGDAELAAGARKWVVIKRPARPRAEDETDRHEEE